MNSTAIGEVCIANISPAERRQRLIGGLIPFGLGLALLVTLVTTGRNRWWRLTLLPLFGGAAVGIFQWRDKTCVGLAARGERKFAEQAEQIEDASELAQVRRQARQVQLKSLLVGVLLTLLTLPLPQGRRKGRA